jgi:hypothetical protein
MEMAKPRNDDATETGMKPDKTAGQDVVNEGHLKEISDDNYAQMSDSMAQEQKDADGER